MLKGFDQTTNIILQDCHERVFSPTAGVEQVPLGLYIIRGDNMCVYMSSSGLTTARLPFLIDDFSHSEKTITMARTV
jgi:U6 snRNA-associated Sm-like protein LSm8